MDQIGAYRILNEEVQEYQHQSIDSMREQAGETKSKIVTGDDGIKYLVEATIQKNSPDTNQLRIDLMVCTSDTGPLKRIDHTIYIDCREI